ncbi:MAG: hypothetical protein ACMUJM_18840 [bacterium]
MKKMRYWLIVSLLVFPFYIQMAYGKVKSQIPENKLGQTTYTEQNVYVPYENLKDVMDKHDKGIFIPYSDFLKLWEEATQKPPEKIIPPPPVEAAIIHAYYRGVVHEDLVEFHGELKISALKDKWATLCLYFNNIALTSLSLNELSPLLHSIKGGLELVIPEKGDYTLKIDFSTKVESLPGKKIINFNLPSSPLTKIDLTIPGKDLDVKIEPMLSQKTKVTGSNTHLSAFISPDGEVNINWLVKSEMKMAQSLLFAKLFSELNIKESVYTILTHINLSIMQAKTDEFKIRIPPSLSLVRVDGKNIKEWEMSDEGILTVILYEKISGSYDLTLITEKYREFDESIFDYPAIEIVNAQREEGIIAVKGDPSLRIKVEKSDMLTQIDSSEVPKHISHENSIYVFKYFRHPFNLSFHLSNIQAKIKAHQKILILFTDNLIDYRSTIHYKIKDAGVFNLQLLLPDNFRVIEIGNEQSVESYSLSGGENKNILTVMLKNKAFGDYYLPLHLEADKEDKNISVEMPKLECLSVKKEDGIIALCLRKNLKLSTNNVKSLRPISLEELRQLGFQNTDQHSEIAAGYRYATMDYMCQLDIEKRKTKIIAALERTITIEETVVKSFDTINYQILYAPVSHFKIEVPELIGKEAVIIGENIKEKRFLTDDKEKKGVWEIDLHAPCMDRYSLRLNFEQKIPEIKTGEMRIIEIPSVRILDVFNEYGHISIMKSPNLQIEARETNLESIDTKELPVSMNQALSTCAFKYLSHPYSLSFECTKHDYEKVLSALITQAHFDIVISEEGIAKTEALYRVKNSNRQSLEVVMPKGIEKIYSVYISGKKASISRGTTERNKIIMLPKDIKQGQEFTIRMIYQAKVRDLFGWGGYFRIEDAEINDVPLLKVTWRLYVPASYSSLYMKGSIHPDNLYRHSFEHINSFVKSQQVYDQDRIQVNTYKILKQSDEKEFVGLDVDLIREGKLYHFSKLDAHAYLNVLYIKKNALYNVSVLLFLLTIALFSILPSKIGKNVIVIYIIPLGVTFLLTIFIPQGFKYLAWLIFWGIAAAGLAYAGRWYYYKRKNKSADIGKDDEILNSKEEAQ